MSALKPLRRAAGCRGLSGSRVFCLPQSLSQYGSQRTSRSLPRCPAGTTREGGSASVEFIGWTAVVVLPLVYLLVVLAQVQAASFAVVSAADAASRVLEVDGSSQAVGRARVAAGLALSDQGVEADPLTALSLSCASDCSERVVVTVEASVPLPGLAAADLRREAVTVEARRSVTLADQEE
ncbi:peptidase T4 [Actinomyces wuliandei]|uniref:peptidase T4 n=1 Tax=Actinomyces wuliandei TaxID=2057743 RepID=UPI001FAA1ED7|nr:peptidase T4 [Actinomyces wuliandei]